MHKITIILFFLFCCCVLDAQKPVVLKSEGEKAFSDHRWAEALDKLTQYQQLKPGDLAVLSKIGQSAYQLHLPDQAKQYLTYVTIQGKSNDPLDWFYLARTQHGLLEWEQAIESYKQFLRRTGPGYSLRENAKDNILRCVSGIKSINNDEIALIENLGNKINTQEDEFAPLPSINHNDRIYFSSNRSSAVGGKRNNEGFEDNNTGHYCSDMYFSQRQTTGWDAPQPFSSLQNTSRDEVALDFTSNGKVLHYFRGFTLYAGEIFTDTSGLKDEYVSVPKPFEGAINAFDGDQAPFYCNDSVVLFASRRTGGYGGLDLWASRRFNGIWATAINLGPEINSNYDETTPFLAPDGITLYFSSNKPQGIGGFDIWKSTFLLDLRQWTTPVTMGIGINSPGDDSWLRLSTDGATASFASNRLVDNLGGYDLYAAYFKEPVNMPAQRMAFAMFEQVKTIENEDKMPEISLAALYYSSDRDVLSDDNNAILKTAIGMAKKFPEVKLMVTVHSDESGPLKFDLYACIKKAEIVGKSLVMGGVQPDRILLRSAGSGFPIARNFLNGSINTIGQTLNKRIEIAPVVMSGNLPMDFKLERPVVNELMAAGGTGRLDEQYNGLIYRVEMAVARQVLTSDALGLFTDLLIESDYGVGEYHYLAGAERTLAAIGTIKKDVIAAGFTTASIVAYINGVRINRAEAVGLIKKYPDLAAYIRG